MFIGIVRKNASDGRPRYFPGAPRRNWGTIAPIAPPATSAMLPAPRKSATRPARAPMPAQTTPSMIRFATLFPLLFFRSRIARNEHLFVRTRQFETLANFELLLAGVGGQTMDPILLPLHLLHERGVALLLLLNQALFFLPGVHSFG